MSCILKSFFSFSGIVITVSQFFLSSLPIDFPQCILPQISWIALLVCIIPVYFPTPPFSFVCIPMRNVIIPGASDSYVMFAVPRFQLSCLVYGALTWRLLGIVFELPAKFSPWATHLAISNVKVIYNSHRHGSHLIFSPSSSFCLKIALTSRICSCQDLMR